MAQKFKSGDIVQLKSGGPPMTISSHDEHDRGVYLCVWFKGASRESARFDVGTLKSYEPPKEVDEK